MSDIVYSNNPNEDSVQVSVEGKHHKASLVRSVGDTEFIYQNNVNINKVLFTGEDGKKHTATLTKDIGNTEVDYQNNPNVKEVLFTGEDGKKHTAVLVKNIDGGGSAPVIDELNVTPTTSAQTITAPSGTDGYSPVNVAAVTSAIDANIVAGNIKKDVQILGVTGSYEGVAPSGTKSITTNGIHDVAGYANADVQVPTTAPAYYKEYINDNGMLKIAPSVIDLDGITDVATYALYYAYYQITFPANTTVALTSLTTLSTDYCCSHMFDHSSGIISVDLSSLTTVSGASACLSMFRNCNALTSINLSNLTTISNSSGCNGMFQNCNALVSVSLPKLSILTGSQACAYMFNGCASLTSLSFSALTSSSFGTRVNQFNNLISGVTGCTIHFPSNLDPASGSTVISSLTGYPNFGGTNTVLAFDLPATE